MGKRLNKLLEISGEPISKEEPVLTEEVRALAGKFADELLELLRAKNGFYAFESALRVLPHQSVGNEYGLVEWNDPQLWISEYQGAADGVLFFAEDIFGDQFAMKDGAIVTFETEAAKFEYLAEDLEDWADKILSDYPFLTGYPFASDWQKLHGALPPAKRLFPIIPFVMGGEFDVDNLYVGDPVERMRFRAHLWNQFKDVEDGSEVTVVPVK